MLMSFDLPKIIPIFPLSGVIFFPKTDLPLNIFEKKYLQLINDCMKKDKYMGMVQSKKDGNNVYQVGCLGKINNFQENQDGRVLITLTGINRFIIKKEINNDKLYREFEVEYNKFISDKNLAVHNKIDNQKIDLVYKKTKQFFEKNGLLLNWKDFDKLDLNNKINSLSMIAPISNEEKQKLLETVGIDEKITTLSEILEFYMYEKNLNNITLQ